MKLFNKSLTDQKWYYFYKKIVDNKYHGEIGMFDTLEKTQESIKLVDSQDDPPQLKKRYEIHRTKTETEYVYTVNGGSR